MTRGDEVILNEGYGSANLKWDVSNTPAPDFASARSEQFTAASILLLHERGN